MAVLDGERLARLPHQLGVQRHVSLRAAAVDLDIVKAKGLEQVSDTGFLDEIITQVLAANADAGEKIKAGNDKAINALKGQVMKLSQGKANPKVVGDLLEARLKGP
jgi:Asp-tRNA(Asn)/Glu-tRNA(Gln) amidotransferase B subunit